MYQMVQSKQRKMNTSNEIYKHENLPIEEWSRIERVVSDKKHKSFDQHQKDFLAQQENEQKLTDWKSWEQYQQERENAFLNNEIETE